MGQMTYTDPYKLREHISALLDTVGVTSDMSMQERARAGARLAHLDEVLADNILHDVMPYITSHVLLGEDGKLCTEFAFPYIFSRTLTCLFYCDGVSYLDGALYTDILSALEGVDPDEDLEDD